MRALIAALLVSSLIVSCAYAHTHGRPDLDQWFMKLRSKGKYPCCDFSEAKSIEDPDWGAGEDGNYWVMLDGKKIPVPADSVVDEPNKFGPALVWPKEYNGEIRIMCFLPGAGA